VEAHFGADPLQGAGQEVVYSPRHCRGFASARSSRAPNHVVKRGKTPVLTVDQARYLLDSVENRFFGSTMTTVLLPLLATAVTWSGMMCRLCRHGLRHDAGGDRCA
jgi:hypothetical protein